MDLHMLLLIVVTCALRKPRVVFELVLCRENHNTNTQLSGLQVPKTIRRLSLNIMDKIVPSNSAGCLPSEGGGDGQARLGNCATAAISKEERECSSDDDGCTSCPGCISFL